MHMRSLTDRFAASVMVCGAMLFCAGPGVAQAPRSDSLEQWIRQAYQLESPAARGIWRELGWSGVGFGFRSFEARRQAAADNVTQSMQAFGANMEYFRIALNEVHASVDRDIGLVWGVHTEEYKLRGQAPESVRVRFTNTLRWDGTTWKNLLYHRDAQEFDATGRYVRKPQ